MAASILGWFWQHYQSTKQNLGVKDHGDLVTNSGSQGVLKMHLAVLTCKFFLPSSEE